MILKGLQKTTLIDFPGHVACTVFTQGCNFRCPFCHNPELVLPNNPAPDLEEKDFFNFLESRKGLLEGVCITGGEPTLHQDLPEFIKKIKDLGFKVKLDTNGTNPTMLKSLLDNNLLDFVAMDIKNSAEKYAKTVGLEKLDFAKIQESVSLLKQSGLDHEFRTTVVPGLHETEDMKNIAEFLKGEDRFAMQNFHKGKTLDPEFKDKASFTEEELEDLKAAILKEIKQVDLR